MFGTIEQSQATTNVPHPDFSVDAGSNRLIAPAGSTYSYDAAGNQSLDNYGDGSGNVSYSRSYDAENRMVGSTANYFSPSLTLTSNYTYDADGRRVKRNANGIETWQVYGMDGELVAEYKSGAAIFLPTKEYGYRGGELLVTMASGDDTRLARFVTNLYYGAKQTDPTSAQLQDGVNQLAATGAKGYSQLLAAASQIARGLFTGTNSGTN